jgi:SAM-dependent methyltransferase
MNCSELQKDIIEWDIVNWSKILEFWMKNTSLNLAKVSALEIGSRHGGLSLWAALQGAMVECTDLESPEFVAQPKHKKYGVEQLVKYSALDVLSIPDNDKFDVVIFKSVLGGLGLDKSGDNQAHALEQIYKVLKPGGELFFAENLTASWLHQISRKLILHRHEAWRYTTKGDILVWTGKYQDIHLISYGFVGAFGRTEFQRKLLGSLDQHLLSRFVPSKWHYILVGIAKMPINKTDS